MASRLDLHTLLLTFCPNVYFQAPASDKMIYPCIKYERNRFSSLFADNLPYNTGKQYTITVIDLNPDSLIPDQISKLPMCIHDRSYKASNLNHDVFNIYF